MGPPPPRNRPPLVADPRDLLGWAEIVLGVLPSVPLARRAVFSADLGFAADQLDDEVVAIARRAACALGLDLSERPVRLTDPEQAWTALRDPAGDRSAAAVLRAHNDRVLDALFAVTDVLLTPTTPGRPHGHDGPGEHRSVALTWAFNLSGHPAVNVPAGRTADGAPVGLQIVARRRADRQLFPLAARSVPDRGSQR